MTFSFGPVRNSIPILERAAHHKSKRLGRLDAGSCVFYRFQIANPEMLPSLQTPVVTALKVLAPLADWYLPLPPVNSNGPLQLTVSPSQLHSGTLDLYLMTLVPL